MLPYLAIFNKFGYFWHKFATKISLLLLGLYGYFLATFESLAKKLVGKTVWNQFWIHLFKLWSIYSQIGCFHRSPDILAFWKSFDVDILGFQKCFDMGFSKIWLLFAQTFWQHWLLTWFAGDELIPCSRIGQLPKCFLISCNIGLPANDSIVPSMSMQDS